VGFTRQLIFPYHACVFYSFVLLFSIDFFVLSTVNRDANLGMALLVQSQLGWTILAKTTNEGVA
jgi:hypothetical protein